MQAIGKSDGWMGYTTGDCNEGMEIAYPGECGYHPTMVSPVNTTEQRWAMNRSGNRAAHEGAAWYLERAARLCRGAGFKKVLMRGDTDFTRTEHLDRWDAAGYRFVFGIDAMPNLVEIAENLPLGGELAVEPESAWGRLDRPVRYTVNDRAARAAGKRERASSARS